MLHSTSCGIIPMRRHQHHWEVLLVQLHAGHWGFPKGHVEKDEQLEDAAVRELLEETGLRIKHFLTAETFEESYIFTHRGDRISKRVIYYLAEVEGELTIQPDEIKAAKWVKLNGASQEMTFPIGKAICEQVNTLLKMAK